ncbi:MAG: PHB depolymerase family esterase [Polaromonas sp.]|uniref:extracellular catalytic domain type 1 short-chain-length polyhydroxyalkanoate depolymerase n=1 Tax=Polaromonas sp. TaxID=1869339 RepID=UPI0017F08E86|nr:PHB depolymerase family esterase [Polaromonas sp.]MBA3593969.1 PHB depolymerase family esterase [Polaromonas sp.]
MNTTLNDLMREATRLTQSGRLTEATAAIQQALRGGSHASTAPTAGVRPEVSGLVLDGCVFEVDERRAAPAAFAGRPADVPARDETAARGPGDQGSFISGSHTQSARTLRYKLFVPPCQAGKPLPLVVMLHGCTQNPDDFAVGTGMNALAHEQGFYVLYPEQAQDANPQRCWNWFKHNHQQRGSGEPAVIAGMTQAVMKDHGIDPRRVYVVGLSAGGAMAAIVAGAYPEVFAAVGVHSGLPCGAASNVGEALAAMKSGSAAPAKAGSPSAPPTIVFHGDADRTVHPRNGEQVVAAVMSRAGGAPLVEQGVSAQGQRYTRSTWRDGQGKQLAEHWLLHGAGHAWSGGDAKGSYTDARGADATSEMLRFFRANPQAGGAAA